jgi:tetratricopeptide (TPR) repeat protein
MSTVVAVIVALLAQATPQQPPANPESKAKAQSLLKEGSALFEQGDYQSALDKFEQAFSIFPSPKLQFNIAQADRALGRPVEALGAYETFVAKATDASPDAVNDARRSITELRSKLGQLRVDCTPSDATVTVDGKPVWSSGEPIWAVPGYHQVAIQRKEYVPAIESVEILAGKVQTLTIKLRAVTGAAPAPVTLTPAPPAPAPEAQLTRPAAEETEHRPAYRKYLWAGVGTTGALAVGAIVAGLMANSKYDELEGGCAKTTAKCSESQIDSLKTRVHVANALWVLTGAAALTTGVVFYMGNREGGVSIALRY